MDLPVLIMIIVAGIFVLALFIFIIFSKKQEAKERQDRIKEIEKLDLAEAEKKKKAQAQRIKTKPITQKTPPIKTQPSAKLEPEPAVERTEIPDKKPTEEHDKKPEETPDIQLQVEKMESPSVSSPEIKTEPIETEEPVKRKYDYGSIFDDEEDEQETQDKPGEDDFAIIEKEIESEEKKASEKDASEGMNDFISGSPAGIDLEEESIKEKTETTDEISAEDIFRDDDELDIDKLQEVSATFGDDQMDEEEIEEDALIFVDDDIETETPSEEDIENILDSVAQKKEPKPAKPEPAKPKPAAAPNLDQMDPEERKQHEKARRIARVIINDIRNYNPDKLAAGIQAGNIMKTLGVEIERGRQLYIKRVSSEIVRSTNYYREAIINILADGRPDMFGW